MLTLLPSLMYTADAVTRGDFVAQDLLDERAYIATWMARTRDLWRYVGLSAYASTRQPSTKFETDYGVDAIVVIKVRGRMKFFAFEAKRPGLGKARVFDRKPKSTAAWSRFSRQIMRQAALQQAGWVTGALLLDERAQNTMGFDPLGSIFVPHDHLIPTLAKKKGTIWVANDVRALAKAHGVNVKTLMEGLVTCSDGYPTTEGGEWEMLSTLRSGSNDLTSLERELQVPRKEEPAIERAEIFGISGKALMTREDLPRGTPQERFLSEALHVTGAFHGVMFVVGDDKVEPDVWERWQRRGM